MAGKYRVVAAMFDRIFRNNLNANFDDIDTDIKAVDGRVSNIVASVGSSNTEIVDARGGSPVLKDRLDAFDSSLAEKANKKDIATVYASDYKTTSNTWTQAINAAYSALPAVDPKMFPDNGTNNPGTNYTGVIKLPAGDIYIDGITTGTYALLEGQGEGATILIHNKGISSPLIHFTSSSPYGGVRNMSLVANDLTTAILYSDSTIDNQFVCENIEFQGVNSTVICDAISIQDYLNLDMNKLRFDSITGYAIRVRDGSKKTEAHFCLDGFTLDNGGVLAQQGSTSARGLGLFYMDTTALQGQSHPNKGTVSFKNSRIELNLPLNANELIRIIQPSSPNSVSLIYNLTLTLENIIAFSNNNARLITCNASTILEVTMTDCKIRSFKEIYNNDNHNASNAIQSHNQNNFVSSMYSRTPLWSYFPYNLTAQNKFLNRNIYTAPNLTNAQNGFYKNGDLVFIDNPTDTAIYIANISGAKGFRGITTQTGELVSITAGSTQVNIIDSNFNMFNTKLFIGMEIQLIGAGASGANLNTIITDVNYNGASPYFIVADTPSATVASSNPYLLKTFLVPIAQISNNKAISYTVSASVTYLDVNLPGGATVDTNYVATVSPYWNTTWWITNKTTTSYRINFGTPPASASALDCTIIR